MSHTGVSSDPSWAVLCQRTPRKSAGKTWLWGSCPCRAMEAAGGEVPLVRPTVPHIPSTELVRKAQVSSSSFNFPSFTEEDVGWGKAGLSPRPAEVG